MITSDTLAGLPASIRKPTYDRSKVRAGIAHLSVGNFHRAHQAVYTDRVLALGGQDAWGILGIGLIDTPAERAKAEALKGQGGLYSLTEYPPEGQPEARIVGSIVEYLHAPADIEAVLERLADPAIRIVTMTITEGGYNIDETGRFKLEEPAFAADLKAEVPRTSFGILTEALRRRRDAGVGPFSIFSCDNLRHNGSVARNAVLSFAHAKDPALAGWIENHVTFPSSMVDRITPAVGPADVNRLNRQTGIDDATPVFAEDFIQWVVEDDFCAGRPAWEKVGVQFTGDVNAYEQVKLRMLNAAHLALAYPGTLMGYRLVHLAMQDRDVRTLLEQFMARDAAPLLDAPADMPTGPYAEKLISRFSNPAIGDQMLRLCSNGAAKMPVYLQDNTVGTLKRGAEHRRIALVLAAYADYIKGTDDEGQHYDLDEPHLSEADKLLAADPDLKAALDMSMFAGWDLADHAAFAEDFARYRQSIRDQGTAKTLSQLLAEVGSK